MSRWVSLWSQRDAPPVPNDIHPLVVSEMRQDLPTLRFRLLTKLVHQRVQLERIITSARPISSVLPKSEAMAHAPIDDITGLHEHIHIARPMSVPVHDVRHLEHLKRVGQIAMEVTNRDNLAPELASQGFDFSLRSTIGGTR